MSGLALTKESQQTTLWFNNGAINLITISKGNVIFQYLLFYLDTNFLDNLASPTTVLLMTLISACHSHHHILISQHTWQTSHHLGLETSHSNMTELFMSSYSLIYHQLELGPDPLPDGNCQIPYHTFSFSRHKLDLMSYYAFLHLDLQSYKNSLITPSELGSCKIYPLMQTSGASCTNIVYAIFHTYGRMYQWMWEYAFLHANFMSGVRTFLMVLVNWVRVT